jgi:hypothetical protein
MPRLQKYYYRTHSRGTVFNKFSWVLHSDDRIALLRPTAIILKIFDLKIEGN